MWQKSIVAHIEYIIYSSSLYLSITRSSYIILFSSPDITIQEGNCTTGDIRIVGKDNTTLGIRQGRVEICINNAWGTICKDASFDAVDAGVVCQQLPGGGFYREGRSTLQTSM